MQQPERITCIQHAEMNEVPTGDPGGEVIMQQPERNIQHAETNAALAVPVAADHERVGPHGLVQAELGAAPADVDPIVRQMAAASAEPGSPRNGPLALEDGVDVYRVMAWDV